MLIYRINSLKCNVVASEVVCGLYRLGMGLSGIVVAILRKTSYQFEGIMGVKCNVPSNYADYSG